MRVLGCDSVEEATLAGDPLDRSLGAHHLTSGELSLAARAHGTCIVGRPGDIHRKSLPSSDFWDW